MPGYRRPGRLGLLPIVLSAALLLQGATLCLGKEPPKVKNRVAENSQKLPDIQIRVLHQEGFDKGYGDGDRWTVADLKEGFPHLIDVASKARFSMIYVDLSAGWVNEADPLLGTNLDALMSHLVRYGKKRRVGLMIALGYTNMMDKRACDRVIHKLHNFEFGGSEARQAVAQLRVPLCPATQEGYYLRAARRVLSWHPAAIVVSFNDMPPLRNAQCLRTLGVKNLLFQGRLMAKIARDVDQSRRSICPSAKLYFLPRFYGPPHWKAHPEALPDLLRYGPPHMDVMVTGSPALPYLKRLRQKYGERFLYWLNLTSNMMKEQKVWFATDQLDSPAIVDPIRGVPGSAALVNLGVPSDMQGINILMAGRWLWRRRGFDSNRALRNAAFSVLGVGLAPLVCQYASLITWPVVYRSLPWNVVKDLQDRAGLEDHLKQWEADEKKARTAAEIARQMASKANKKKYLSFANELERNAREIRLDDEIAVLFAQETLSPNPATQGRLRLRVAQLGRFIQDMPLIPNDPKNAEVAARGFLVFRKWAQK